MTRRLVVFASGSGSNLQAVIDACARSEINARVVAVVSNNPGSGALARAAHAGIGAEPISRHPDEARREYDARLAALASSYRPDFVVLAGWMLLLSSAFLDAVGCPVINLHPALPGELPGTRAIERAFEQATSGKRSCSGVMVHLVPDEGVDCGPVLGTAVVDVVPGGTFEAFERTMHEAEHRLLVSVLRDLCATERKD